MKLSAQTQFPNVNMISEAWWQEGAGSHTVQSSRQARRGAAVAPPGHGASTLGWPANKVTQDSTTSAVISARQTAQRTADTRQGQPDFRTEGGSRRAPSNDMARAAFAFTGARWLKEFRKLYQSRKAERRPPAQVEQLPRPGRRWPGGVARPG